MSNIASWFLSKKNTKQIPLSRAIEFSSFIEYAIGNTSLVLYSKHLKFCYCRFIVSTSMDLCVFNLIGCSQMYNVDLGPFAWIYTSNNWQSHRLLFHYAFYRYPCTIFSMQTLHFCFYHIAFYITIFQSLWGHL